MIYGSWDISHNKYIFLSFWGIFCPFTPLTTRKVNILEKWRKGQEILSFYKCVAINDYHAMYGSWDIECDRQNILLFWTIFCPFTPLTTWKIKILKKLKKKQKKQTLRDIIILHMYTINDKHDVWFLRYGAWQREFFCHFGPFFAILPY